MDREKLRQIKRPNQVKVIFMNSCPLLSDLPMIIPTSQKGKKNHKNKNKRSSEILQLSSEKTESIQHLAKWLL